MTSRKPITVVGGGLAGLTLGIGLRQRDVPVMIWEAAKYPRHRVCGEFISGRGQATLQRLGLRDKIFAEGAIDARTVAFFSRHTRSVVREMPEAAISVSRFVLDDLLAKEFRKLGGELRENERWRETVFAEGVMRANGRRLQSRVNGWRWFGLKVHARNVQLDADLEMHLAPSGYMGISRLKDGEVNICGLFRRPAEPTDGALPWQEIMRGEAGSKRDERLNNAIFEENSFCSVAGLSLEPQRAAAFEECCVGDAITMIPPVTGNGMSMAFESAEIAIAPVAAYSSGDISWAEARKEIARRCDAAFARRLAWAGWLQRLMFKPSLQGALVIFAPRWEFVWKFLLNKMR